nr:DUF3100 domain-containing protein [Dongshaea marina]
MAQQVLAASKERSYYQSLGILFIFTLLVVCISESLGVAKIPVAGISITLLPMLYAVIIGTLITPDLLGKWFKPLGKILTRQEVKLTGNIVMLALLPWE